MNFLADIITVLALVSLLVILYGFFKVENNKTTKMSNEPNFTTLEKKIVSKLCDDLTPKQISEHLDIHHNTVNEKIRRMKQFYNVKTIHGLLFKHFILNKEY